MLKTKSSKNSTNLRAIYCGVREENNMRPIFTIHAGEFLVGEYIEKNFPTLNVWIPSKDTGTDFLVTNKKDSSKSVAIQVKMSRDYKPSHAKDEFSRKLLAGGWLTLAHDKIEKSPADYWVFILVSHERKMKPKYIIIPPSKLLNLLVNIHGKSNSYHFYPWVLNTGIALHGRGLLKSEKEKIATESYTLGERDLSIYLENWAPLEKISNP
ncbi:hypothetical protein ACR30L_09435 [Psychromonas sp. PT13]|uniref:hypothetical protein n=1 Tax=Psychromonas sp. PT13 TaxID=3439547 RepID=UPI003EC09B3E